MNDHEVDRAFTAESPYGMGHAATYAGALSVFRRKYSKDLTNVDIAFSGIPFDHAVTNRPGARFGPRAIRAASTNLSWDGGTWPWGFDPFLRLSAIDYGDCYLDPGVPDQMPAQITAHASKLFSAGVCPVSMGGDHFVTYPILRACHDTHGPVSLIHFDAHSDTWAEDSERIDHGTMFYDAARLGLVEPARSVQIGLRTHNDDTHGFNILDANWVHEQGPLAVAERVREIVGDNPAYLTFDIDCLDPSVAPGTGTPVCGGLSAWQAQTVIRKLAGIRFVGMDLVEVAPAYDIGEITALAGASLMLDFVCLLASSKAPRGGG